MRITYNWLKEFIDLEASPEEVAQTLTDLGIEVNSLRNASEGIEKVVVGRVEEVSKHPNADRLKICLVNVGDSTVQIVTGADNVYEGAKVPVALVGARLPGGIRIKKSRLRGADSFGMICSEEELGLAEKSQGIMVLPENVEVGRDIVDLLSLNDWVIDYEITTNRPDALSVLGIARELRAFYGLPIRAPELTVREGDFRAEDIASLRVLEPSACPRYDGFVIRGISNVESPLWLKVRLMLVGLRPINAVVDVTNYVMYELGQPLHAFDLEKLSGSEVVVRRAKSGEEILTLDGVERKLTEDDLVIADSQKPVAIAGIIGGEESGVDFQTETVFLESAHFDPMTVRRTSKRLGISTDSSYRFERGADIEATEIAAKRAVHMIQSICGGDAGVGKLEFYEKPYTPKVIAFSPEKVRKIVGVDIPPRRSSEILSLLGFPVRKETDYLIVKVPSWRRYDVSREIDLIEEVVRVFGMKNVVSSYPMMHSKVDRDFRYRLIEDLKLFLESLGLSEVISYSFVSRKLYETFGLDFDSLVKISNPLSEEWIGMRDRVFPSLVNVAVRNVKRQVRDLKLFEVSNVFINRGKELPEERLTLCVLLTGELKGDVVGYRGCDFYDIKGISERFLKQLRLKGKYERSELGFLHPGQSADILVSGRRIGFLGKLHPSVCEKLEIGQDVLIMEVDLESAVELSSGVKVSFEKLPKYPPVMRDISLICDESLPVSRVEETIREAGGKYLEKVELFDVYRGRGVPEGKKSLSFALSFRSKERTLSDEEVTGVLNGIIKALAKIGVNLRA